MLQSTIHCLAFSTCGRYLASGSADNKILIWDLSHGQLVSSLNKHTGILYTLAFSRDGNILTAGGLDCLLTLWDFSKLTEDHVANISSTSSSHNPELGDGENYLLRTFPTKNSSFLSLHFTRRNLLISVGVFKS
ncbi:TAF5 family protein [Megaselia abdita]